MANYLCSVTEVYRCDTEEAAKNLIESAKHCRLYELKKYNCEFKERKMKGEIIDAWYKVSLTKAINDEKEPGSDVRLVYTVEDVLNPEGEYDDED